MSLVVDSRMKLSDIIELWVDSVEHLDEEEEKEKVKAVYKALRGCANASILSRMPYSSIVNIMVTNGLTEGDALSLEMVLGDSAVFPREGIPVPGAPACASKQSAKKTSKRKYVPPARGDFDDEFTEPDDDDEEDGTSSVGGSSKRGGARRITFPVLKERRVTKQDIADYHHPEVFYHLPSKINDLSDTQKILATLFQELETWCGDTYMKPFNAERLCVTSAQKLRNIGIPNPPDWGGRPRTWDVCMPPKHTHITHTTTMMSIPSPAPSWHSAASRAHEASLSARLAGNGH